MKVLGRIEPSIWFAMGLATLFNLVFNLSVCSTFNIRTLGSLVPTLAISFLSVAALFLWLSMRPSLFRAGVVVVTFLSAAALYFIHTFNIAIDENSIALLFETNLTEFYHQLNARGLAYAIGGSLIALTIAWFTPRELISPKKGSYHWVALGVTTAAILLTLFGPNAEATRCALPHSIARASYIYLREQHRLAGFIEARHNLGSKVAAQEPEPLTVVLIIGETARADHLQINGYPRATTPELMERNVISFARYESCETNTRVSVPCMMTRATRDTLDVPYRETSFISIFRKLGFDTWWLSNQCAFCSNMMPLGRFSGTMIAAIAEEAAHVNYVRVTQQEDRFNVYDQWLLPHVDKALAHQTDKQLVVLHTGGSHWAYESHYTREFQKFNPICTNQDPNACDEESLFNSYDNAILYTDHFLAQVIDKVATRNAIVLYASDHGESLGEDGIVGHTVGSNAWAQRNAAMFVWMSDAYRALHPDRVSAVEKHRNEAVSHRYIFHTVLDCAGVRSEIVDQRYSLCR